MTLERLAALRAAVESVSPITDEAWGAMAALFRPLVLPPEQCLVATGEMAQLVGWVESGILREYFITREGKEFNKAFILPGNITGSLFDLLSGEPSIASIQALTETTLMVADYRAFSALYDQYPCCQRLGRLHAEALFSLKARREYEFMTLDAQARYQLLLSRLPQIETHVAQYHIASYLGITPVALSRIKKLRAS